ncbi:MAG: hypothetical protein GY842_14515, partial [bacterium]|nr:hypothetical protein [bacterium]
QDIEALLNDVPGLIPGRNVALGVSDSTNGTEKLVILAETHATEPAERASVCGEVRRLIASGLDLVPADVRLVPPRWLRKSSSGKVSRAANRERYLALPPESAPPLAIEPTGPCAATSTLEETILHCVRTVMERKGTHAESALGLDNTLITSGLIDSLTLVSIILELENALSLHIPPHCLDLGNFDSVATIAAMIRRLRTEADEGCRETVTTAAKAMSLRERKSYDFLDAARDIDALFLGSSKAMPLHTKMSGEFGYRAFNFTVYSSRAEDWSCILRFVLAQRAPLRLVVLGMDVEAFSNAVPVDRRLLHCAPLVEHLDAEGLPEFQDERSASSPQTDEARFQTVLSQYKLGGIEEYEGAWAPQTGDYSRPNDPTFEQRQPLRLDDPLACRAEYAMRMRGFTHLDPRRLDYFASFIHKCRSRDIQVVTFMMPLHQELDRYLRQATSYAPRYAELEAYLGGLSGPGLHYHPALTTASFDGDDQDFIDGAHLGGYNADRLLRYLLQSQLG